MYVLPRPKNWPTMRTATYCRRTNDAGTVIIDGSHHQSEISEWKHVLKHYHLLQTLQPNIFRSLKPVINSNTVLHPLIRPAKQRPQYSNLNHIDGPSKEEVADITPHTTAGWGMKVSLLMTLVSTRTPHSLVARAQRSVVNILRSFIAENSTNQVCKQKIPNGKTQQPVIYRRFEDQ